MPTNVIGMSQYADGGAVATKPYTSGGAYISRMSDHCRNCRFDPKTRLGPDACPFTAGYWAFVHHHADLLAANMHGPGGVVDATAGRSRRRPRAGTPPRTILKHSPHLDR